MTTSNLSLPELAVGQSSKETTHNEALNILDFTVQATVLDKDLTTPPGSPSNGDAYIVGGSATGDWSGQDDDIAYWLTSAAAWQFITPSTGWEIYVVDEVKIYHKTASGWVASPTDSIQAISMMGGF